MTVLSIRPSPGYGMRGSHPNGDFAAPGQAIVSDINVPPESLLYGQTVEVGDPITYTVSAIKSGGGSGSLFIDSLGVPHITGAYGTYGITATWTNQTTGIPVSLYSILPHTDEAAIEAQFNYLPQDANGWSIITPSADSRLIYLDPTGGNDGTAVNYLPSTLPNVNNWNDPGAISAYQTAEAAESQMRAGLPDWILVKRGETVPITSNFEPRAGRSLTERSVLTAYGPGTERPSLRPADNGSIIRAWGDNAFTMVFKGIEIYPTWCDPDHVDFDPINGLANRPDGLTIYNGPAGGSGIIIEDCRFRHLKKNVRVFAELESGEACEDIIFRRNVTEYATGQGFFANDAEVIVEENVFYHCGWWTQTGTGDPDGQASIFDHSLYCPSIKNSIIRNNISIAPSSIHFKLTANTDVVDSIKAYDIVMYNNFMFEGEIGLSLGGNDDQDTGARWRDMRTAHNVGTQLGMTRPTNRDIAWGEDIQDWEGGMSSENIYFDYGDATVDRVTGLVIMGHCSDVIISNLVVNKIGPTTGTENLAHQGISTVAQGGTMTNVQIIDPIIQLPNTDCRIIGNHEALTGVTFVGGKYHSGAAANEQFNYNGTTMNHADWVTNTGDTGALEQVTFVDDSRTLLTYLASVGETATRESFIDKCRNRQAGTWDPKYDARYINPYFREGLRETA